MSRTTQKIRLGKVVRPILVGIAVIGIALLAWWSATGSISFHLAQRPNEVAFTLTSPPDVVSILKPATVTQTSIPPTCTTPPVSVEPVPAGTPIVLIGTVIDGTGADPLEDTAVVIEGEHITWIGPRVEVEIPAGAAVFDLHGVTILPGFINAHVHNGYDTSLLKRWAQQGVTMVRDLGARHPYYRFSLRDENNQDPQLATVIAAGPLVTVPGGYPIAGNNFPSLTISNADEARSEISALIEDGADVIKIVIQEDAGFPSLPMDSAKAIVETAHQAGIAVSAHLTSLNDLIFALEAGVDDAAHIVGFERVPEPVLAQMVDAGMIWVPTLEPFSGRDAGNLRRFIDLGGKVALGNDGGMLPGIQVGMPIEEIEMMHAAGLSPMEIIVASTSNAAAVCQREETHGTLEIGKIADLLVVFGDPLEDLAAMTEVRMVIHRGVIIRDTPD